MRIRFARATAQDSNVNFADKRVDAPSNRITLPRRNIPIADLNGPAKPRRRSRESARILQRLQPNRPESFRVPAPELNVKRNKAFEAEGRSGHARAHRRRRSASRTHRAMKRYLYAWGDGHADGDGSMRDLLGGKGAGLAEMTKPGSPVPPGFTITTEACNDYFADGERLPDGLLDDVARRARGARAQDRQALRLDPTNPLLVSVRSGAKLSMPGMMDTVLNLGLNDATLQGSSRSRTTSASAGTRTGASSRCSAGSCSACRASASTRRSRPRSARAGARRWTSSSTPPRCATSSRDYRAIVQRGDGPRIPERSASCSSSSRSSPCSRAGSASARATTASSTRSPTTSAPR